MECDKARSRRQLKPAIQAMHHFCGEFAQLPCDPVRAITFQPPLLLCKKLMVGGCYVTSLGLGASQLNVACDFKPAVLRVLVCFHAFS